MGMGPQTQGIRAAVKDVRAQQETSRSLWKLLASLSGPRALISGYGRLINLSFSPRGGRGDSPAHPGSRHSIQGRFSKLGVNPFHGDHRYEVQECAQLLSRNRPSYQVHIRKAMTAIMNSCQPDERTSICPAAADRTLE